MARPTATLDSLTVPKGEGAHPSRPPAPEPERATPGKAYAHTLSLRLTAEQYRRLRRYVAKTEDETGERVTHQAIIEGALTRFLDGEG